MALYIRYPATGGSGGGGGSGVMVYANFAAFPSSAANGTLAVDGSTHILYEYNTTAVAWQPIASPASYASTGNPYYVNLFTLSPTDISNGYVTLAQAPDTAVDTQLTVVGGPMQNYGPDFTVSGSRLSWSGLFLSGVLVSGDQLIVQFN